MKKSIKANAGDDIYKLSKQRRFIKMVLLLMKLTLAAALLPSAIV